DGGARRRARFPRPRRLLARALRARARARGSARAARAAAARRRARELQGRERLDARAQGAASDDVVALRVLVAHGADLSIRTAIDDFATPLEEARILGKLAAVEYLESLE